MLTANQQLHCYQVAYCSPLHSHLATLPDRMLARHCKLDLGTTSWYRTDQQALSHPLKHSVSASQASFVMQLQPARLHIVPAKSMWHLQMAKATPMLCFRAKVKSRLARRLSCGPLNVGISIKNFKWALKIVCTLCEQDLRHHAPALWDQNHRGVYDSHLLRYFHTSTVRRDANWGSHQTVTGR